MSTADERITALRAFNRFYTRRIGVLHEGLLDSRFSLTESRLLWELAHCDHTTASALAQALDLDPGYLSRLLRGLKERGLLKASRSSTDARQTQLSISAAGQRAFVPLDRRSQAEVAALLQTLTDAQQQELLAAMARIETLLGAHTKAGAFVLRAQRPGDIGWVVSRHGALYAQEYGWDMRFEALVAQIAAGFVERFDAAHEACWIAERDGSRIGSVFLVRSRDEATQAIEPGTAQLRMLLVEPSARGLGLGVALVNQCERFARQVGYQRIRLWTNSLLLAARGIYQRAGYKLLASEPHHSFGHDLVGETWELALD
jgi:DNA-binding MarR family transcriptional regulator/N-acetylglutamate synthase-like GNAT family acetyltransferase